MPTLQRRKRAIERTREDILEAAARALGRSGYGSATMRSIAREAGYTAASLYTYFKSKQEILQALLRYVDDEYLKIFDEPMPAGLSFRQKTEILFRRELQVTERRRDLFSTLAMAFGPAVECTPTGRGKRPAWHMEVHVRRMAEWLRANARPADIGRRDPVDVARFMVSAGHGFFIDWVLNARPEESLSRRADLILDLIFHGIAGERPAAAPGGLDS